MNVCHERISESYDGEEVVWFRHVASVFCHAILCGFLQAQDQTAQVLWSSLNQNIGIHFILFAGGNGRLK